MESMTIRNVNEIPASQRSMLESMLGQQLAPEQQVFVIAYTPNVAPDPAVRAAARKRLQKTFEIIDRNAQVRGVAPEEAEAAIDEAMEHVRPRAP